LVQVASNIAVKKGKGSPYLITERRVPEQWHGEQYDGTSTRTGPLQSKKIKIKLKDNAKK